MKFWKCKYNMQNLKSTKLFFFFCIVLTALFLMPCAIADEKSKTDPIIQQSDKGSKADTSDHIVRITILQLNDVYERPLSTGREDWLK
jgi:hypothetical protein